MKKTLKILEWIVTFGMGLAIYLTFFKPLFPVFTAEQFNKDPLFCNVLDNICKFFIGYLSLTLGDIIFYFWSILLIKYKELLKDDSE